ncbi:hypothetical protein [Flavobacterium sp.]|uniref:hypothetical protein n=1 Tax=Flavobacterium sp. TaxID=239 RepID=UPI00374CB3A3
MAQSKLFHIKSITEFHRQAGIPLPENPVISIIDYSKIHLPENNVSAAFDFYSISIKRDLDYILWPANI